MTAPAPTGERAALRAAPGRFARWSLVLFLPAWFICSKFSQPIWPWGVAASVALAAVIVATLSRPGGQERLVRAGTTLFFGGGICLLAFLGWGTWWLWQDGQPDPVPTLTQDEHMAAHVEEARAVVSDACGKQAAGWELSSTDDWTYVFAQEANDADPTGQGLVLRTEASATLEWGGGTAMPSASRVTKGYCTADWVHP
ncbi:hypothetical protein [Cellulomonas sp. Leaf334]|uniref:hypothetical protein n=1 Tax=Cellulomonas sp. Leaf334 TaxID=1736339 RepID=UPI0007015B6F|nr:hypothetical protein [Cellulomonas sp. Leaf334]KQR17265.1 hypothetical protein ASF78_08195 [Cellulomonas sp. Leaf334]